MIDKEKKTINYQALNILLTIIQTNKVLGQKIPLNPWVTVTEWVSEGQTGS